MFRSPLRGVRSIIVGEAKPVKISAPVACFACGYHQLMRLQAPLNAKKERLQIWVISFHVVIQADCLAVN